jgi:acylphosphatase
MTKYMALEALQDDVFKEITTGTLAGQKLTLDDIAATLSVTGFDMNEEDDKKMINVLAAGHENEFVEFVKNFANGFACGMEKKLEVLVEARATKKCDTLLKENDKLKRMRGFLPE